MPDFSKDTWVGHTERGQQSLSEKELSQPSSQGCRLRPEKTLLCNLMEATINSAEALEPE